MRLPQMGDERMFQLIPDNVSSLFACPTPTRATSHGFQSRSCRVCRICGYLIRVMSRPPNNGSAIRLLLGQDGPLCC
jgi:hypothetical protein